MHVTGHFGEWLQGRLGPDGPVVLVTLLCREMRIGDDRGFDRHPLVWTQEKAESFLRSLNLPSTKHALLHSNIPPGAGAGASTAHLVALARSAGFADAPERLARACVAFEGASDPLMFPNPDHWLWASRLGESIFQITPPPHVQILGGFWGLGCVTDPKENDFADVSDLVSEWQAADTLHGFACVASQSAERRNQVERTTDPMGVLAQDLGALGHVRAHTGSARGLIFAPNTAPEHGLAAMAEAGLTDVFAFHTSYAS